LQATQWHAQFSSLSRVTLKICRPDVKFQNLIKFIIFIYFKENLQKTTDENISLIMNQQLTLMWPDMFYSHTWPMGGNLPPGISQPPDEIEAKFQLLSPFLTTAIQMELMGILPDVTGSGKSKMAVYKLVPSIYRLVDEIERRFQRKTLYLRCPVTQGKNGCNLNQTGSGNFNKAVSKPEILISRLLDEIETKFRRLHLNF